MSLEDVFRVQVDDKVEKEYEVCLGGKRMSFKPVDILRGRRIELEGDHVVACQNKEELFELTYCNGNSLDCRTFRFKPSNSSEDLDKEQWISSIKRISNLERKSNSRKMLVLVNPKSGKGNALSTSRSVTKVLEKAGFDYELLVTERQGHAEERQSCAQGQG